MRELLTCRVIFGGKVQRVGFRSAVKEAADRLQITGFVRNLQDGTVEILAQGEKLIVEKLLSALEKQFSCHVTTIDYSSAQEVYKDFKIIFGRDS